MPHEAETMTFRAAWLMRAARSWGAKPPDTTEWIAPVQAAAKRRGPGSNACTSGRCRRPPPRTIRARCATAHTPGPACRAFALGLRAIVCSARRRDLVQVLHVRAHCTVNPLHLRVRRLDDVVLVRGVGAAAV